ncbi:MULTISPECIES: DUF4112 domain-containing protein [Sphingobium]|jgi:hypothetical protein|uniref:DUF4112 domain-containing protein n=1 Tax=Sphingobium yanoikuyae TaxID=13690 RepID=A0A085KAU9_SPHYA|nr:MULTISPECIES: DUF4112 domain-containing protein [Sphingobium]RSU77090.1 DUF4112 domain-containing protein [Sphingomonas sp. S-NIH.Pt3_0716]ATI78627.1 DUF4112 domain-containing protein [Sphingobium yanoikuyae]ATP21144.1 hypothetical protein BV87_23995 [Sphingobium yanoikuyae]AYO79999.1 DUF4112 domain-containing protein [Sphingobium yanoikuyae]KEZ21609.1 hypothetical protein CP98_00287 [Sphingobium yanoikuyae]
MPVSAKQFDDLVRDMPGFGRDPASIRRRIEMMEAVLEGLFVIPGTKRRVGMDSLIGLVPVVGDIATAAMGAWIVWEARNLGLSKWQLTRMAANVGVDTLVGAIPFAGDIFDFLYKSNTKNLRIIRKHLDRHHPSTVTIDG